MSPSMSRTPPGTARGERPVVHDHHIMSLFTESTKCDPETVPPVTNTGLMCSPLWLRVLAEHLQAHGATGLAHDLDQIAVVDRERDLVETMRIEDRAGSGRKRQGTDVPRMMSLDHVFDTSTPSGRRGDRGAGPFG